MEEPDQPEQPERRDDTDAMLRELFPDLDPAVVRRVLGLAPGSSTPDAETEE